MGHDFIVDESALAAKDPLADDEARLLEVTLQDAPRRPRGSPEPLSA